MNIQFFSYIYIYIYVLIGENIYIIYLKYLIYLIYINMYYRLVIEMNSGVHLLEQLSMTCSTGCLS